MRYVSRLSFPLLLSVLLAGCSNPQTNSVPPPVFTQVPASGASIENGVFESRGGGFSIAIPQMPLQTLDSGSERAKARGVDTGKTFVWKLERTIYTAYYYPPVDRDGNRVPQLYEDLENGTRKGILRSNAKLNSEKPIKFGENRGTEFRYMSEEGVAYIGRIYLIGDVGYQIVGGYSEDKYEKEVLGVLNSFKLLKSKP